MAGIDTDHCVPAPAQLRTQPRRRATGFETDTLAAHPAAVQELGKGDRIRRQLGLPRNPPVLIDDAQEGGAQ